jgi:hypothetical protein
MSVDLNGFDANEVEPSSSLDPVPNGEYTAIGVDSEFKQTKKGDGEYLQFTWEIVEGQYRGRRLFDRLNLKNSNETAVKIAQSTLSAICRAVGVMRPKDSAELHNKPLKIKVVVKERDDKPGSYSNELKGYESVTASNGGGAKPAATSDASTPPWKRKSA